jgi:Stress responsive A/B Barrel Domain
MIRHVALFSFKPETSAEDREATLETMRRARDVPSVRSMELGRVVATSSLHARGNYQFVVSMTFDDVQGFEAYLAHPLHKAFGPWVFRCLEEPQIWTGQFELELLKGSSELMLEARGSDAQSDQ